MRRQPKWPHRSRYALCQGHCGFVPLAALIPDANDPPGRCPDCGGQTCNCGGCVPPPAPEAGAQAWLRVFRWPTRDGGTKTVIGGRTCASAEGAWSFRPGPNAPEGIEVIDVIEVTWPVSAEREGR